MSVSLQDINQGNFHECVKLSLPPEQQSFVSPNVYSIAESKIFSFWIPKIIYKDEIMVGFLMYAKDYEDGKLDICRIMIDSKYQGKGYGKAALEIMKNIATEDKGINRIVVHVKKENQSAKEIYMKLGYEDMTMIEYEQEVFILRINRNIKD